MKRILMTGATGFIGSRVLPFLRTRGYEIHVLGRARPQDDGLTFHFVDLRDSDAVRAVAMKVQASHLLHLAWDVTPGRYWRAPENLDWVSASLQLVRAFETAGGRRAVLAGTCAEYQWGPSRLFERTSPCIPVTLYGVAKHALEQILATHSKNSGLSTCWGRIFFLYGPDEKPGRLVSDAIHALMKAVPFPTTHGKQKRDFLHVHDVAGAFAALVDSEVQGPINIGSGEAISIRSLLSIIASMVGNIDCLQFGRLDLPDTEPAIIEADTTRLTQEVRFDARYNIRAGLADTVSSWKNGDLKGRLELR